MIDSAGVKLIINDNSIKAKEITTMFFEKVSEEEYIKTCTNERNLWSGDVIKMLHEEYTDIQLPRRATSKSAGYDFIIPYDINLVPGNIYCIPTGIKMSLSDNTFLAMYPRSGLGRKYGFRLLNTVGIIDADYYNNSANEGHIMLMCEVSKPLSMKKGDRFVQGVIQPYGIVANDLPVSNERTGGFGSTGN